MSTNAAVRQAAEQATNAAAGTVLGAQILGLSLADWASIAAIVWFAVQTVFFLYTKLKKVSPSPSIGD